MIGLKPTPDSFVFCLSVCDFLACVALPKIWLLAKDMPKNVHGNYLSFFPHFRHALSHAWRAIFAGPDLMHGVMRKTARTRVMHGVMHAPARCKKRWGRDA